MADTEELLAQLLAQNAPQGMSLEQQQLKRKRDLAQAQLLAVQNQGPRPYRRNPIAFALDGLMGLDAKEQLKAYDNQELASAGRTAQGRNSEMAKLLAGLETKMVPQQGPTMPGEELPPIAQGDPRAAVTQAMASTHPEVRALAAALQKQKEGTFKTVLDATRDQVDPSSAVAASQNFDPKMLQFPKPAAPFITTGTVPGSDKPIPYGVTTNKDGTQDMKFLPVAGTNVTVDTAGKAITPVIAQWGKDYGPGGAQQQAGAKIKSSLASTQDLLDTLAKDPQMGAGASGFQTLRKWAQTLGAPVNEKTTPTEMATMQLGQKVLERLGGLGAQVSDPDREFMIAIQGSIGSDPAAVRKLLLLEAKYMMQAISAHNDNAEMVDRAFEGKITFPKVRFSFKVPQPFLQEMQEIWGSDTDPAPPRGQAPRQLQLPGRIERVTE
jgi:hypothetical protein